MMNNIQSYSLEISKELGFLVSRILLSRQDHAMNVEASIAVTVDDRLEVQTANRIYIDDEDGIIKINCFESGRTIEWYFLSMSTQELIANCLFLEMKTLDLLEKFRMQ